MNAVGGAMRTDAFACGDGPARVPRRVVPRARNTRHADAIARAIGVALFAAALASCTTIVVRQGQANVEVTHHFGIANVRLAPLSHAVLLDVQSIGAAVVADGLVVGVSRSEVALLDEQCRLVLWHPMPSSIEDALRESEHICSIPSSGGSP
jgi:hypothetical protein